MCWRSSPVTPCREEWIIPRTNLVPHSSRIALRNRGKGRDSLRTKNRSPEGLWASFPRSSGPPERPSHGRSRRFESAHLHWSEALFRASLSFGWGTAELTLRPVHLRRSGAPAAPLVSWSRIGPGPRTFADGTCWAVSSTSAEPQPQFVYPTGRAERSGWVLAIPIAERCLRPGPARVSTGPLS
jgi:hypothetical protein